MGIFNNHHQKKLKIIIVTDTYPPDINGVANSLHQILVELKKQHEILILQPEENNHSLQIQTNLHQSNLKKIYFPFIKLPFYNEVKLGLPLLERIHNTFKLFKPDIVHIVTPGLLGLFSLLISKQFNLPVIADFRTNFHQYIDFYGFEFLKDFVIAYLNYFHNQCDLNLVPTLEVKKFLQKNQIKNVKILGRGIRTNIFNPNKYSSEVRKKYQIKENELLFLYVGRIAPEKNINFLCNIFINLQKKYHHIKLMVVGDGPLKSDLEKQFPSIIFVGKKEGEELATIYASSDIFLFPSKTETFGNVFLESYASGLPIISYHYAATRNLYSHNKTGFLIPINHSNENHLWIKYIEIYSKNIALVKKHKKNLIEEHKSRLSNLSWEAIANKLNDYYLYTINKSLMNKKAKKLI